MKKCVINFGRGAWYPRGQARLVESLKTVGWSGDVLAFGDERDIGAPTHRVSPYAFKPFALQQAVDQGYELVLWADSSCWAIKPIEPMFEHIAKHGHLFFCNGSTGNWSSDASLTSFGLTREEAFNIEMLMGICMGFDMRTEKCKEFLKRWLEKATDGVTFPGAWTNKNQEVSKHPLVYGHRHDQTAASIIAGQLGMKFIVAHEAYFQYYQNSSSTPYDGDLSMIYPNVVMCAQGML